MKLDLRFDVPAPIDAVWPALNDLESVVPCLPGATLAGHEDGIHHGEFTLRVGPFSAVHRGTLWIEAADTGSRVQRLLVGSASGNGSGASIVNTLTEADGGTRVDAVAELTVAGPLAVFVGSGVIEDVANRLLRDFATCLAARLNTPAAPTGAEVTAGEAAPEELLAAAPPGNPRAAGDRGLSDCGICGGDVPPVIAGVLTGTGLTVAQAAARLEQGEELPALTPVQRRIVEARLSS